MPFQAVFLVACATGFLNPAEIDGPLGVSGPQNLWLYSTDDPPGTDSEDPPGGGGPEKSAGKKKEAEKKDPQKSDGEPAGEQKATPSTSRAGDPDFEYVKANLKDHLHGTFTLKEDGTLSISYDLRSKKEEYQGDFQPPISAKSQAIFRWSVYQEERTIGGDVGVRVSDRGAAFLKVWFTDDVEATATFLQGINWSKRQYLAVAFQAKSGKAIGNNYGGQCAAFSGIGFQGGTPLTTETTVFNSTVDIGLKVRGGTYEALRGAKSRKTAKYVQRNFSSGRVGLIWGGGIAGTLTSFSVNGKLDVAATAREMRKGPGAP